MKDLETLCRQQGLSVISYFSLASGFLTGKCRSAEDLTDRARANMVKKYLNERGLRILAALDKVARQPGIESRGSACRSAGGLEIVKPVNPASTRETQMDDVFHDVLSLSSVRILLSKYTI